MTTAQDQLQPPGQFITIEGHQLHYVDLPPAGAPTTPRTPVLMVHGKAGSVFDYLLSPLFPNINKDRRVIVIDRMGCGFSRQADDVTLTLVDHARIVQALLDKLDVWRPILIGHSMGSAVALAHALANKTAAKGYLLLAPIAFGARGLDAAKPMMSQPPVANFVNRTLLFNGKLVNHGWVWLAFAPNQRCIPDGYTERAVRLGLDPCQLGADLRNLLTVNASLLEMAPRYGEIEQPVIILAGDRDLLSNVMLQAEPLAESLPHAQLMVLPKTGHMVHFAHPELVLNAVERIDLGVLPTPALRQSPFSALGS